MSKILIVEDDAALRNDIADRLMDWGHDVFEASDGNEGISAIDLHQPELILCDINMPCSSGFDMVKLLRERSHGDLDLPFIFISALSDPSAIFSGLEYGANDYITKPVNYTELKSKIEFHLNNQTSTTDDARQWLSKNFCDV